MIDNQGEEDRKGLRTVHLERLSNGALVPVSVFPKKGYVVDDVPDDLDDEVLTQGLETVLVTSSNPNVVSDILRVSWHAVAKVKLGETVEGEPIAAM